MSIIQNAGYKNWLRDLKSTIQESQIKAALAVNTQLIILYFYIGSQIVEKQKNAKWGSGFINQLSKDLKAEFPEMGGFSSDNIRFMQRAYLFYNQQVSLFARPVQQINELQLKSSKSTEKDESLIVAQLVQQLGGKDFFNLIITIPWGHHTTLLRKIKDVKEALFYISKTIENNWSRSVLEYQIETNLFYRQGKAVTNFKNSLPAIQSDLANELLKSPYNFEFITLSERVKEKDLEQKLIQHISQFLLELGKGFAYMGRQFQLKVGSKEYRTDLLFYHTKLKSYIVIELKIKEFEPEFIGKINFYISAINELVKDDFDGPTIGILLCKNKDDFEVEFALKDVNNPIGVSEYRYKELPENIKENLSTLEALVSELKTLAEDEKQEK
ncbi:MAG: PDDEXK nuclease domain-containing protein [Ginsengibacter sp.]